MALRGWVYVLSTKGSPDLVKIGYSTKDPALRAAELDGTGVPFSFIVEYDVLVENPREVEQETHRQLKDVHANKEFFQTTIVEAVKAIRRVIAAQGKVLLVETEGEILKSLSVQAIRKLESFQRISTQRPTVRPARGRFVGRSYSVACRQCMHVYSIAQINFGEKGEAICPLCGVYNCTLA
jgi:hypothetical protein